MTGTSLPTVRLVTDGACSGNPGPGGWACILSMDGRQKELFGGEPQTTNNRMELTALLPHDAAPGRKTPQQLSYGRQI